MIAPIMTRLAVKQKQDDPLSFLVMTFFLEIFVQLLLFSSALSLALGFLHKRWKTLDCGIWKLLIVQQHRATNYILSAFPFPFED